MTTREVKLKINVEGILNECKSINGTDNIDFYITAGTKPRYSIMLERIFNGNLEIEGKHSDKENEMLLNIVKNRFYQSLVDNNHQALGMHYLYDALKGRHDRSIAHEAISLANDLIKINPFIYNPKYGVTRKYGTDGPIKSIDPDDESADLSARTCTLEIDDADFLNLKSLMRLTSESLNRQNLDYIAVLVGSVDMDVLKKYSSIKSYYTLEELYDLGKDGMPLADYGLNLIYEKYYRIEELIGLLKDMENKYSEPKDITAKVDEIFAHKKDDLKIIISVASSLKKIKYEKELLNYMIQTLEYLVNNNLLWKEADEQNTLQIKPDLSNFYKNCVIGTGLDRIVSDRLHRLDAEIKIQEDALEKEELNYSLIEDGGEKEEAITSMDKLKEKIYSLKCEHKKEKIQCSIIEKLLHSLRCLYQLSPQQEKYMLKKIEEFVKARKLKMEVEEPEEEKEVAEAAGVSEEVEEISERHQVLQMDKANKRNSKKGIVLAAVAACTTFVTTMPLVRKNSNN
ncbi:hypothetical protein NEMIN01_1991 [Nematocida minor]|uniref:uncharacterized protein n=1 Tax=Nematocida minor TaxID=1912983 RepID=UPI00222011C3|nr:uncharacterized protein NEMIN01_1991 [Nematocida minor]KAI5192377.1 hypothetical protein NEMIN01_1991 [Nematocida minor]